MSNESENFDTLISSISKFYDRVVKIKVLLDPPKLPEIDWLSPKTILEQLKNLNEQKQKAEDYKIPKDKMILHMAEAIADAIKDISRLSLNAKSDILIKTIVFNDKLDIFSNMVEIAKSMILNNHGYSKSILDKNSYSSLEKLYNNLLIPSKTI